MIDLESIYDRRNSFHGKAKIDIKGNEKTLYSYDIKIITICGGKIKKFWDGYSLTTQRHINEFLLQNLSSDVFCSVNYINKKTYKSLPCNEWVNLKDFIDC